MGFKNIFNQKFISKAPNPKEEALYKRVLDELESGKRRTGIMAKAIADSLGDSSKAESLYIKYRMQTIADEDKKEAQLLIEEAKLAEEKAAEEAKLAEEKAAEEARLAREKAEIEAAEKKEEQRLRAREKWRSTKRYKLINFSWKASVIYLIYFVINIRFFEYSLPSIIYIDQYLQIGIASMY